MSRSTSRCGNGSPLSTCRRDTERGKQRHRTSDAGPADDHDCPPGRSRLGLADLAHQHPRQVGPGEDPDEPRHQDRHEHRGRRDQHRGLVRHAGLVLLGVQRPPELGQLEADDDEGDRLEDVRHHVPDRRGLQSRGVVELSRLRVAQHEPGHDDREESAGVQAFCAEIERERGQQDDGVLEQRVVQLAQQEPQGIAAGQPQHDAAADRDAQDAERVRPGHRRRDGGAQRDAEDRQRGPVVHEALALEDRQRPPGQTQPAADGRRGDRVRRAEDRAERQGDREGEAGDGGLHRDGDRRCREDHEADGQQQHRSTVLADPDVRRVQRLREQQRGQRDARAPAPG